MPWNFHDREDAAQEVELRLLNPTCFRKIPDRYRRRAVQNTLCSFNRKESRRRGIEHGYAHCFDSISREFECDPSAECEKRDHANNLRRLIRRLPLAQRVAVEKIYLEGHSIAEASQLLGKSEAAVNSARHNGLQNLRRALTEEGHSP